MLPSINMVPCNGARYIQKEHLILIYSPHISGGIIRKENLVLKERKKNKLCPIKFLPCFYFFSTWDGNQRRKKSMVKIQTEKLVHQNFYKLSSAHRNNAKEWGGRYLWRKCWHPLGHKEETRTGLNSEKLYLTFEERRCMEDTEHWEELQSFRKFGQGQT